MKFNTKAIHAGIEPDPSTGAIMTPIFQTSTYVQEAPGVNKGYAYARTQNPTRDTLENSIAALENGYGAICYGSGLAAMDAILKQLKPGDEVLAGNDIYGGSYRLLKQIYEPLGITSRFVDMSVPENIKSEFSDKTALLWLETPTNPTLKIVDIEKLCAYASEAGVRSCVDNTFATPYLQRPLELGADLVMHSATKYLGGHSDVVLGAIVTKTEEEYEGLKFVQKAAGAIPGPQDCFLVLRGIKTLHLRVQRACENAMKIAQWLNAHDAVAHVYYPGLSTHPNHDIAKKQMSDFGGMVSFDLKEDTTEAANKILSNTKIFALAESLGGVESLIGHPATMTHASIPRPERIAVGITDSLIRLSVGVEDVEDLLEDLDEAM